MTDTKTIQVSELDWRNHYGWVLKSTPAGLTVYRQASLKGGVYSPKLEIGVHSDWLKKATRVAAKAMRDSGYEALDYGIYVLSEEAGTLLAMQFCGWQTPKEAHGPLMGGWQNCRS